MNTAEQKIEKLIEEATQRIQVNIDNNFEKILLHLIEFGVKFEFNDKFNPYFKKQLQEFKNKRKYKNFKILYGSKNSIFNELQPLYKEFLREVDSHTRYAEDDGKAFFKFLQKEKKKEFDSFINQIKNQ